jgi:hypothetical protein
MKQLIFIVIMFLSAGSSIAQVLYETNRSKSLEVDFGTNQVKDKNLHNKVHSGILTSIMYNRYKSNGTLSNFSAGISFSALKTAYENEAESLNAGITLGYRKLFYLLKNENLLIASGPSTRLNYNFNYFPNWDESHLYWANQLNLGLSNMALIRLNKSKNLLFDFTISVVSLASRPEIEREYKYDNLTFRGVVDSFHSNISLLTLNKALDLNFRTEYQFSGKKISPAILYELYLLKLQTSVSNNFINNHHKIGLKFYF